MSTVTKMAVGGVQHLVERAYRESGEMQYVRELFVNAIEAGAMRIEFSPEWRAVESEGVYRLMVADNGKGMSADELLKFLNTFGGGGKPIGDAHENYGVGAKTSLLPWNHAGVVVLSWTEKDPEGSMVQLMRDPSTGEYGARCFETADGYQSVVAPSPEWASVKPEWLTHGTVVVCLGNTGKENTFLGKDGKGDIKGISAYLNKRIWKIPEGVTVTVRELRTQKQMDWPRSWAESVAPAQDDATDRRTNNRDIKGAKYHVVSEASEGKLASKGTVKLEDGTEVDWYLWQGERPAIHSYAQKAGFIAALYRNELYDTQTHLANYRSFGITQAAVRERLTIVARPPYTNGTFGVYPDTARNALKIQGTKRAGEPLPWSEWGQEFAENMPSEIREALAKAGPTNATATLEDAKWRDRLMDRFGRRWKSVRYLLTGLGSERVEPSEAGGPAGGRDGGGHGKGNGSSAGSKPGHLGGQEGERKFGAKRTTGTATAKKMNVSGGLPSCRWTSGDDVEAGFAGAWCPNDPTEPFGVVLLNRAFPAFVEVKQYWREQYPDHLGERVDEVIEEVYGQAMIARIAHSEQFVHDKAWGKARVDAELRSPAAITMAALGLVSEDQVILAKLTGLLGRRRAKPGATPVALAQE